VWGVGGGGCWGVGGGGWVGGGWVGTCWYVSAHKIKDERQADRLICPVLVGLFPLIFLCCR